MPPVDYHSSYANDDVGSMEGGQGRDESSKMPSMTGKNILTTCDNWIGEFDAWHKDCARVSQFYSGKTLETEEDQNILGLIDHTNFSPGRKVLQDARDETYAYFSQPQVLISFKLKEYDGTPSEKVAQERMFSSEVDRFVRLTDPVFMDELRDLADRHVMHGDPVMAFSPEEHRWRPFQSYILTDIDAPQNMHDDNFHRWAVAADLQISEIFQAIKEKRKGWKRTAKGFLKHEWNRVFSKPNSNYASSSFEEAFDIYCELTAEEWESQGQTGRDLCTFYGRRLKAYYYYSKDFSEPGKVPVDLHIVARFASPGGPTGRSGTSRENGSPDDPLLFHLDGAFESVRHAAYEFVLDGNLGVESPSWGSIKGLGHINFYPDSMTNLLMSVMQNSAIDRSTPLYQAIDVTDQKLLEKWIQDGYRAHAVAPAGLNIVDKSQGTHSVGEAISLIQFFQAEGNRNAANLNHDRGRKDELEVQALDRRNANLRSIANRGYALVRKVNSFVAEVGRRIAKTIHEAGPFHGEIDQDLRELRECLLSKEIELEWFYPENLVISYVRLSGDGDPERRQAISAELVRNLALIPDEERPNVLKEWYASLTGDWERAEAIWGQGDQAADTDPRQLAFMKVAAIMEMGTPVPVTAEDLPEITLPVVIKAMESEVVKAEGAGVFDPHRFNGFVAVGRFGAMLAQKLTAMGKKDLARTYEGHIEALSRRAQGPYNNMLAKAEAEANAENDNGDQIAEAKLQLDAQKLQLAEKNLNFQAAKEQARDLNAKQRAATSDYHKTQDNLQNEDRIDLERARLMKDTAEAKARMIKMRADTAREDVAPADGDEFYE